MNKPYYSNDHKIRVQNNTGVGRQTIVSIGDVGIPVRKAVIWIEPDDYVTMEITVKADDIDITALKKQTMITIKKD